MARSLFRLLHRRYGSKLSGADLQKRSAAKREQFERWFRNASLADCSKILPRGVAVVGAGFSGLSAAFTLAKGGAKATVFEARDRVGGRVETDRTLAPGRLIEAGAELIGLNHPMWISLSLEFRLGHVFLTSEDQYAGIGLDPPLRLKGAPVTDQKKLHDQMKKVFQRISDDAKKIPNAHEPWMAPDATKFDGKSVADQLAEHVKAIPDRDRHPRLVDALELQFANDQVVPVKEQSYLGLLALVAGGKLSDEDKDLEGYWTTTEDFRCAEGNDRLAVMMQENGRFKVKTQSPVQKIEIDETKGLVKITWLDVASGKQQSQEFDFVILATPPSVWGKITITPALPAGMEMAMGPAVKYLSRVAGRFWIKDRLAPGGWSDEIGQTWEATENQTEESKGIVLSTFAGGAFVPKSDGPKHFRTRLPTLYPSFKELGSRYVDWPSVPFIEGGYVCPKVGQVTTIAKFLSTPHKKRLFFASEQADMAYFGYMEGALQSGAHAAAGILKQCALVARAAPRPQRERIAHELELLGPSRSTRPPLAVARTESAEAYPLQMTGTDATYGRMMYSPARSWRLPSYAEEDTPPETPGVTAPKGLVLLSHSQIRRTCPDGKSFTSASSATTMSPATMNPGFLKADDTIEFDTALDAKLVQLILDTPKYRSMVSAESRSTRAAHREDRLRVALVDITGDKICKPGYASWGSTFSMPGGSTPKVLILFAAHQLILDLNEMARTGSITTRADLTSKAATAWSGLACKPDLNWLVDLDDSGSRVQASASAKLRTHLKEMITRSFSSVSVSRASELMLRLGFEYIASVAFQSGLRHPTRAGLWLGNTYLNASVAAKTDARCHRGSNPIVWSANPLGATGITLTALSAATFFTLLAQRRLVNSSASLEMETLLETGCGFVALPGITRRATKCGLTSSLRYDAVLLEGSGRAYVLVLLVTDPSWADRSAFVADLDRLVKENNP